MKDSKKKADIPENCPKCGGKAVYRKPSTGPRRCHYCDPPTVVTQLKEQSQQ